MASMSSTSSARAAPGPFPLELAKGVFRDLATKELAAHLFSEDEAKKAAFATSKEAFPRRLALLTSQVQVAAPVGIVHGLCSLVTDFVQHCFSDMARCDEALAGPAFLESSLCAEALAAFFQTACNAASQQSSQLLSGGRLVTAALEGVGAISKESCVTPDMQPRLLALMQWLSDDLLSKRLKVVDAWGPCVGLDSRRGSPLHSLAADRLVWLVPLAIARGCSVNGNFGDRCTDSPASVAFRADHLDFVEALMAHGLDLLRPYDGDGWPLALSFCTVGDGQAAFLDDLIRRQPELVKACTSDRARQACNLLDAAMLFGDPSLVEVALTAGAPLRYGRQSEVRPGDFRSSLAAAIHLGNARVLELVITKGKALENWREKYDEAALGDICQRLALLAVNAYPINPDYKGNRSHLKEPGHQAKECVAMVLASGIICPSTFLGMNCFMVAIYSADHGCVLREEDALAFLQQFHLAGFDVLTLRRPVHHTSNGPDLLNMLPTLAMHAKQPKVFAWSIDAIIALHCPPEAEFPAESLQRLLIPALSDISVACALLLLQKYKVAAAFPDQPLSKQPIVTGFLSAISSYTDSEAVELLGALMERAPFAFALSCFDETSVLQTETDELTETPGQPAALICWNPVYMLSMHGKPRALELLLTKNLPGVAAMVNRPVSAEGSRTTAAQVAADYREWDCLDVLLRNSNARVTDSYDGSSTAAQHVRRAVGTNTGPPRLLIASVEARAKTELADKAKTAAASQAAGAVTNAFEDPSVKPLTEKEERQKAKKKAAKKKAKAKKRAAAKAGAGAESATAYASDNDDSSGDDDAHEEEPDDNLVDSSNAPSLDLMLEQMGLKEKK